MQESSSSHSIPHVALTSDSKAPSISYSASHTTDINSAPSTTTPQFKKKLLSEKSPSSSARESGHIAKHQSFDYAKSAYPFRSLYFVLYIFDMYFYIDFHNCDIIIFFFFRFCFVHVRLFRFSHGVVSSIG